MQKLNLVGQKYNRLTVLEPVDPVGGRSAWKCQCDCGNIKIVKTEELRSGGTKSCGCWNDEQRSDRAENMYSKLIKYTPSETSARKIWRRHGYNEGLTFEEFYKLSQMNCFYCGTLPANIANHAKSDKKSSEYAKTNANFIYNGLDRIDSSKSHTIDNVVPCCKYCNYAKRERSLDDFKDWVERLHTKLTKMP